MVGFKIFMKKTFFYFLFLVTLFSYSQKQPISKKVLYQTTKHDTLIEDNYKWLEESNKAEVKNWVNNQNNFADLHLEEVQKKYPLEFKIKEYNAYSSNGLPSKRGKYFYSLYRLDKSLPASLFFRKALNDDPIEFFNPSKITKNKNSFIASYFPSKNSKYVALELSTGGSDVKQIRFANLDKLDVLQDSINNVKFSNVVWNLDQGIYYKKNTNINLTAKDSTFQIFYHAIGTKQEDDKLIYDATKTNGRIGFFNADNKLVITESNAFGVNYSYLKLGFNDDVLENIIENDTTNFTFRHFSKNKFYFSSKDYDWGEVRFFDINNKTEEKVIIPQIYNHLLLDTNFYSEYIVCTYKTIGKNYISIYDYEGNFIRKFNAPSGFDFSIKFIDNEKSDLYVSFYSRTVSYQNFKLNIKTGNISNFFNDYVRPKPTIFPLDYFETKVITFESRDGKDVPITIIHKKGLALDGNNPTLLEAYGGYGTVSGPTFDSGLLCFLDQGGVYAYAEIRGGGEKGKKWHRDGSRLNKINSFNDFIDAAEFLIKEKYTSSSKLAISGASNGGLLVGAVITMRPDLFKVAIPKVGVFDMLNFDSFTAGTYWKNEYGNINNEIDFKNLISYSPLHNIKQSTNYPITLIITGENDDRVVPSHSYKFAAKLQNNEAQTNPIYLHTLSDAGHSGKVIYKDYVEEEAMFYSFLLYHLKN
jgi:prolyl oligopeptidase